VRLLLLEERAVQFPKIANERVRRTWSVEHFGIDAHDVSALSVFGGEDPRGGVFKNDGLFRRSANHLQGTLIECRVWFPGERSVKKNDFLPVKPAADAECLEIEIHVYGWSGRRDRECEISVFEEIEKLFGAGSSVAGCGPAFAAIFIDALADAGVKTGLPRAKAIRFAEQMILGTAQLALDTGKHPAQLRDEVASPGGATIEGIQALEEGGFRAATINAVIEAWKKH